MMMQHALLVKLFFVTLIALLLVSCKHRNHSTGYERRTLTNYFTNDSNPVGDSVVEVQYNKSRLAIEIYKKHALITIQSKDTATLEYYKSYFNLREMGVDLYGHHCSSCHSWYPDTKIEFEYGKIDSAYLSNMFISDNPHQSVKLSPIEIISIGNYLKLMGKRHKYFPQ